MRALYAESQTQFSWKKVKKTRKGNTKLIQFEIRIQKN